MKSPLFIIVQWPYVHICPPPKLMDRITGPRVERINLTRNRRPRLSIRSLSFEYHNPEDPGPYLKLPPKVLLSVLLTFIIIVCQVLIFYHYHGLGRLSSFGALKSVGGDNLISLLDEWDCSIPGFRRVNELANKFDIDLITIDPDLVGSINRQVDNEQREVTFSAPARRNQESPHKSIIHLAIINETSGGQPNLRLFMNALKYNGFSVLHFDDISNTMQPEVYRRSWLSFDDSNHDDSNDHRNTHDSNLKHHSDSLTNRQPATALNEDYSVISKIYTDFMAHIFILNRTEESDDLFCLDPKTTPNRRFVVIHMMILYNHERDPTESWIQSSLVLDEVVKHRLLSYGVHSFDFRVPVNHYYIHPKRQVTRVTVPATRRGPSRSIQIFEPRGFEILAYQNNSFLHCSPSPFKIKLLIGNSKRYNTHMQSLDSSSPITIRQTNQLIQEQLSLAFQFMSTFSQAYQNFSYWLTGSSLLHYSNFCSLAVIPEINLASLEGETQEEIETSLKKNLVIDLMFGLFSSEFGSVATDDLVKAESIGINMLSDWRRRDLGIKFSLKGCPNLIFNFYLHDLKTKSDGTIYVVPDMTTTNQRPNRKARFKSKPLDEHVHEFGDLELCWTYLDHLQPFRVPCNVNNHLRRIYIS